FATGQHIRFVDYADRYVFNTQPSALMVLVRDPSPCDALLERAGLRVRHTDVPRGDGAAGDDPMLWIDEYLRGVTFDVPDLFDCTFTDVGHNPDNPAMATAVRLFRTIVVFFSASMFLLPLQHLWRFLMRAATGKQG